MNGLCSIAVANDRDAVAAAVQETFEAFIIDVNLNGNRSGLDILRQLRTDARSNASPTFLMTGQSEFSPAEETMIRDLDAQVFYKGESLLRLVDRVKAEIIGPHHR